MRTGVTTILAFLNNDNDNDNDNNNNNYHINLSWMYPVTEVMGKPKDGKQGGTYKWKFFILPSVDS